MRSRGTVTRERTRSAMTQPSSRKPVPAAELRDVTKTYSGKTALAGLDLELPRGAFVALLGPNGAGKTTALSLLLGLRTPDSGDALLLGRSPLDDDTRRRIGVTPQVSAFPAGLKVREVVAFVAAHYPDPMPAEELYERFGLGAVAARQVGGLSGGEQRRLAVSLALIGNPEVVFLDEPSTGLDVVARHQLWDALRSFHEGGGTVLLTTHYLEEAEELAEHIAVINHGRLVVEGTPRDVASRIALRRVRFRGTAVPDIEPVVRSVFQDGIVTLYTPNSDLLVRRIVDAQIEFSELEVLPAGLEEAFVRLTRDDQSC